jgi:hypothetical protein
MFEVSSSLRCSISPREIELYCTAYQDCHLSIQARDRQRCLGKLAWFPLPARARWAFLALRTGFLSEAHLSFALDDFSQSRSRTAAFFLGKKLDCTGADWRRSVHVRSCPSSQKKNAVSARHRQNFAARHQPSTNTLVRSKAVDGRPQTVAALTTSSLKRRRHGLISPQEGHASTPLKLCLSHPIGSQHLSCDRRILTDLCDTCSPTVEFEWLTLVKKERLSMLGI